MPKIAVYVEPFDGYGDFAHFKDIAEWIKRTYPDHQVVPICIRRSDWGDINDSHTQRMLEEFGELGWNIEETASKTDGLRLCGDIIIADTPDKIQLDDLTEYPLAISVSSSSSPFGLLYTLSKEEGFTGKLLHLREIGDLAELEPEDSFEGEQSERALAILEANPLETNVFTMGLAYHKHRTDEAGFMFTGTLSQEPLTTISDKTFLKHFIGGESEDNVEVIATYYQNVADNPSISEHSAEIHLKSSILSVLTSPVIQQGEQRKTLCFTGSSASIHSPADLIASVENLASTQELQQPIASIEVTIKNKEGKFETVTKKLCEEGINIRVVSGFFLSSQDQAILLGNSRNFMGCSGDKSLAETIMTGALPLPQIRKFKKEAIGGLANDIYTLVERGSVDEESAFKLIQYIHAAIKQYKQISFLRDPQEILSKSYITQLSQISKMITHDLLSTWKIYADFLIQERNIMPLLEQLTDEALKIETAPEIKKASEYLTSRTASTGEWLYEKLKEKVEKLQTTIEGLKQTAKDLMSDINKKINSIKQHQAPNQASLEKLSKLITQIDGILEDVDIYGMGVSIKSKVSRKQDSVVVFLDHLIDIQATLKHTEDITEQLKSVDNDFHSYESETRFQAIKKIQNFIKGDVADLLTEEEFDTLKESPTDTLESITHKYFGDSHYEKGLKYLNREPTESTTPSVKHSGSP